MGRLQANVRRAAVRCAWAFATQKGSPQPAASPLCAGGGESHQGGEPKVVRTILPSHLTRRASQRGRPLPSLRDCVASQRMSGGDVNPFFAVCRQVLRVICCRDEPPVQSRSFKRKPMPRYMVYHDANETLVHRQLEVSRSARFACMTFFAFRSLEDDP